MTPGRLRRPTEATLTPPFADTKTSRKKHSLSAARTYRKRLRRGGDHPTCASIAGPASAADLASIVRCREPVLARYAPAVVGEPSRHSHRDRARDLSDTAWKLRATASSLTADPVENEETGRLVRERLSEAVALCRRAGADRELATALRRLGHAEQDAGRDDVAAARYEEAVAAARRTGDPLLLAHAIRHVGDAHRARRRLSTAETCYDEALALYAAEDEPSALDYANAIRPMAILKEALGKTEEARHLWQRAKALYATVTIVAGVAECDENLSRLG